MSSPASIVRPAYVISGLIAAVFLIALAAFPGQGSAMEGSFFQGQVSAEQKKCQAKKPAKAKAACLKTVKGKATAATKKAMAGIKGLYGHNLQQSQIPSRNGTLVWSKELPTTAGAARTEFVLYSSKSYPGDKKIVVSGTMSVPEGTPPAGGWPVVSWAHGTTGLADQCAPSRGGDQGSYGGAEPLVEGWLEDGYAVLATDYEGLGTPKIHPYLVGVSEARGVLDIVRASRSADPNLSKKVVIAGHSQGGHAALFAAEEAPKWAADFDHQGTVAYAPASGLTTQAIGIGTLPADAYGISALATSILRGAVAADPRIDPALLLSEKALELYPLTETECLGELGDRFAEAQISPGELLIQDSLFTPNGSLFMDVLTKANPDVETDRPLLIPQGLQDTTVLPGLTTTLVERGHAGTPSLLALNPGLVDYQTYGDGPPAMNITPGPSTHGSILADAEAQVDAFLLDGFGLPPLPPLPTR